MLYTYEENKVLGNLEVKGNPLELVDYYKYLGITLESSLAFKKELNKVISRVNHKIWILGHFRSCFDEHTAIIILKTMLLPLIH